MTAVSAGPLG